MFHVRELVGFLDCLEQASPVFDVPGEVVDPRVEDVLDAVLSQEAVGKDPYGFGVGIVNIGPQAPEVRDGVDSALAGANVAEKI